MCWHARICSGSSRQSLRWACHTCRWGSLPSCWAGSSPASAVGSVEACPRQIASTPPEVHAPSAAPGGGRVGEDLIS